jgi:biotin carboxyl carrier protein
MKYTALVGDRAYDVEIGANNAVSINGDAHVVDYSSIEPFAHYSFLIDNRSWDVMVERNGDEFKISIAGEQYIVEVMDERTRKIKKGLGKVSAPTGEVTLKAPMPGLVRGVAVEVGQEVKAGQGLVILEAMKMENELRAPRAGVINEVRVRAGEKVEQGQALLVIK